jgi:hypothetical protein
MPAFETASRILHAKSSCRKLNLRERARALTSEGLSCRRIRGKRNKSDGTEACPSQITSAANNVLFRTRNRKRRTPNRERQPPTLTPSPPRRKQCPPDSDKDPSSEAPFFASEHTDRAVRISGKERCTPLYPQSDKLPLCRSP